MQCIFCQKNSDTSKSVEHVIPESIGGKRLVLPTGVVCDKCNNYFSRKVEQPVLSHQSMRNVRGWYQVPTKKGKMPSLKGYMAGTNIEVNMKLVDGMLQISPEMGRNNQIVDELMEKMKQGLDHSPVLFSIDIDPPQKEMSRFLAKMALEVIAYRYTISGNSERLVDNSHYDRIRNFARYGSNEDEWPYHRRVVFPMDTEMRHPETEEWVHAGFGHDILLTTYPETYFIFFLYGVEFAINLGGPSIKGYKLWLQENNNISPIIKSMGVQLVSKTVEGKVRHYLV